MNENLNMLKIAFLCLLFSILFVSRGYSQGVIPQSPSNLTVLDFSFDFVLLLWSDNSSDEDGFIIERSTADSDFAPYDTVNANTSSYVDYRVEPETYYAYRIVAFNADGTSNPSNEVELNLPELPHRPPQAPAYLDGDFDANGFIRLIWADQSDNESFFHIFRGSSLNEMTLIKSVESNTTETIDFNILPNSEYYYYIFASNEYGYSEPSDTLRIETADFLEATELSLIIEKVDANRVKLSWDSISGNPQYNLLRITNSNSIVSHDSVPSFEFSDSNLSANTDYRYQVVAYRSEEDIVRSPALSVKTLPEFTIDRVSDSLLLMYIFTHLYADSIPDYSYYTSPLPLKVADTSSLEVRHETLQLAEPNLLFSIEGNSNKIISSCRNSEEITVEIWIKPGYLNSAETSTVLMYGNADEVGFCLKSSTDEENEELVNYQGFLTTESTDMSGRPGLNSSTTFPVGLLHHVVFVHEKSGNERLYVNGVLVGEGYKPSGFANWEESFELYIGNDPDLQSAWAGQLYFSAIYNQAHTMEMVLQNYYASPFLSEDLILNPDKLSFVMSPNPARAGEVLFEIEPTLLPVDFTEEYIAIVYDIHGKQVFMENISPYITDGSFTLNLSGLKVGIYHVSLYNEHKDVGSEKLVIVK